MIMFKNSRFLMRYTAIILLPLLCVSCQDPDKDAKALKEGVDALIACQQAMAGDHFDTAKLPAETWRPEKSGKIASPTGISEGYVTRVGYTLLKFDHAADSAGVHRCSARLGFATVPGQDQLRLAINAKLGQNPSAVKDGYGGDDNTSFKDTKIQTLSWNMANYSVELRQQSNMLSRLSLIIQNGPKGSQGRAKDTAA